MCPRGLPVCKCVAQPLLLALKLLGRHFNCSFPGKEIKSFRRKRRLPFYQCSPFCPPSPYLTVSPPILSPPSFPTPQPDLTGGGGRAEDNLRCPFSGHPHLLVSPERLSQ